MNAGAKIESQWFKATIGLPTAMADNHSAARLESHSLAQLKSS
jgi:hypothetical protein